MTNQRSLSSRRLFSSTTYSPFFTFCFQDLSSSCLTRSLPSCLCIPALHGAIETGFIIMRPSSLGGAAYCVALCLSVCPSVRPSRYIVTSVTSRHLANYNDTHVLFGEGRISYGHLGRTNSCYYYYCMYVEALRPGVEPASTGNRFVSFAIFQETIIIMPTCTVAVGYSVILRITRADAAV